MISSRAILLFTLLALLSLSPSAAHSGVISNIAAVNGAKLSYEIQGEGSPVVFINDGILDRRMWDDQVAAFAARHKVIRYDFRGWGKSDLPKQQFSQVDDLYHLLQFLRIEKVALVGSLIGGGVAIDFAIEHPERVERLVVMTPFVYGFRYSLPTRFWAETWHTVAQSGDSSRLLQLYMSNPTLGRRLKDKASLRQRIESMLLDNWSVYSVDFGQLMLGLDPPTMRMLPAVRTPTLILTGTAVNPDMGVVMEILQRGIHDARRIIIPNTGSLMNIEQPAEFNRVVLDWLNKQPSEAERAKIGL